MKNIKSRAVSEEVKAMEVSTPETKSMSSNTYAVLFGASIVTLVLILSACGVVQ